MKKNQNKNLNKNHPVKETEIRRKRKPIRQIRQIKNNKVKNNKHKVQKQKLKKSKKQQNRSNLFQRFKVKVMMKISSWTLFLITTRTRPNPKQTLRMKRNKQRHKTQKWKKITKKRQLNLKINLTNKSNKIYLRSWSWAKLN